MIKSGVLHRDADKSRNPYRRDAREHVQLSEYLREILGCWLRIRSMLEPEELSSHDKALHRTAKAIGLASTWRYNANIAEYQFCWVQWYQQTLCLQRSVQDAKVSTSCRTTSTSRKLLTRSRYRILIGASRSKVSESGRHTSNSSNGKEASTKIRTTSIEPTQEGEYSEAEVASVKQESVVAITSPSVIRCKKYRKTRHVRIQRCGGFVQLGQQGHHQTWRQRVNGCRYQRRKRFMRETATSTLHRMPRTLSTSR